MLVLRFLGSIATIFIIISASPVHHTQTRVAIARQEAALETVKLNMAFEAALVSYMSLRRGEPETALRDYCKANRIGWIQTADGRSVAIEDVEVHVEFYGEPFTSPGYSEFQDELLVVDLEGNRNEYGFTSPVAVGLDLEDAEWWALARVVRFNHRTWLDRAEQIVQQEDEYGLTSGSACNTAYYSLEQEFDKYVYPGAYGETTKWIEVLEDLAPRKALTYTSKAALGYPRMQAIVVRRSDMWMGPIAGEDELTADRILEGHRFVDYTTLWVLAGDTAIHIPYWMTVYE